MPDNENSLQPSLRGKTILLTGGSRGIGKAIALRAARDGANVVVAAKTADPHPSLEGTIHTVAAEIERLGGRALPIAMDVRDELQIAAAVEQTVSAFGGIDILINNASALHLSKTPETPPKRFDLMFDINVRGTFLMTQACYPHLIKAANPHVLVLSPPLKLKPEWFADHCAYTMSKYGMSMCVLGMAEEFRGVGIGVNALWPATMIETAASAVIGVAPEGCRNSEVMADAAHAILARSGRETTGRFFLDEEALAESGQTDLTRYAVRPGAPLARDLFVE